jgi:hypothetical protein
MGLVDEDMVDAARSTVAIAPTGPKTGVHFINLFGKIVEKT